MKIELKNIQVAENMSEETTAFTANLYIEDVRSGYVKNDGRGGNTWYQAIDERGGKLIRDAELWCEKLPPIIYPADPDIKDDEPLTIPMKLEHYIDDLLTKHLQKKDLEKFNSKAEKHMNYGLLVGTPDKEYRMYSFKKQIIDLLTIPSGIDSLKKNIEKHILPGMKPGEKILNTNIPPNLFEALGIPPDKIVERKGKQTSENKKAKRVIKPPDQKKSKK